ncbi:MAG: zf-HC2 domain-containing protein [Ignavibacteriales bacterium]|nr:zf-HC2 domain-containing protein [Ignavibacteriales bacterium]MCF8305567.1 zf-HC2 domain-containing protein [Ignavibacteriales bacterium]MCF8315289.1 zf-HC2 domain-containing protein [Ignavibacteriales bacterium]MCF8436819.1 zf-HC2 domain-containing protein [Ignavibacteriales bacterium]
MENSQVKVTCSEVVRHICDNLGEQLNSPKCLAIKEHIAECPDCSKYLNSVEKTIDLYRQYNFEVTDDVHSRLLDKLGLGEKED